MADRESGHGEQYRSRMKKTVAQMGWLELSEEDGPAHIALASARGGLAAAGGGM